MRLEESWLRHLLEWANSRSFHDVSKIRPTLPEYLLNARLDEKKGQQLSIVYVKKIIRCAYNFFHWLRMHNRGFVGISPAWIDTLKPPRMVSEPIEHEAITLEEVRAIAKAPVYSLRNKRIRAAVILLFLSGIRIGAFVTLPISAVDLEELTIKQWPKLGVRTKFKKHATTYLLDIPDLLEIVREWDIEIRKVCKKDDLWFAVISPETEEIEPGINKVGEHRHARARKDLKEWLDRVGLPYHSPHKFRHGHAVYALKRAQDVSALKAVSQNLMHSNLSVTDGVYGILSESDVRGQIMALGKRTNSDEYIDNDSLIHSLEQIIINIKSRKDSQNTN